MKKNRLTFLNCIRGIGFEIRKNLTSGVLIVLGLFLFLSLFSVAEQLRSKDPFPAERITEEGVTIGEHRLRIAGQYYGPLETEKMKAFMEVYWDHEAAIRNRTGQLKNPAHEIGVTQELLAYSLLRHVIYEPLKYIVNYSSNNKRRNQLARENVALFSETNPVLSSQNAYLEQIFQSREILILTDQRFVENMLSAYLPSYLLLLFMMMQCVKVFTLGKQYRVDELETTLPDRALLYDYKQLYILTLFIPMQLLFFLSELIPLKLFYGPLIDLDLPLFSLPAYEMTAFTGSVTQYFFLRIAFRSLVLFLYCQVFIALSLYCRTQLKATVANLAVLLFCFALRMLSNFLGLEWITDLNPLCMMEAERYFQKPTLLAFGYVVIPFVRVLIYTLFLCGMAFLFIMRKRERRRA